ncbi:MAG: PEP-CTERM system TPR-repeat protein PrsT [Thiohalocapsa sp. PB-PSB1]|jgi:putative PEP-CTERM system TPR-repeat lipoprotein|nr:MAG: PEP-CTERM system TPR-repeat protein PrsT [Thiohalocapsa sp. PB-PSB1]
MQRRLTIKIVLITTVLTLAAAASAALAGSIKEAERYRADGDLSAAVIELKDLLQDNPRNQQARFLLGQLHLDLGDGKSAEKELVMAQELGRTGIEPWLARSLLLQRSYQRLLDSQQLDPESNPEQQALMHALRGDAETGLGQSKAAAASYRAALELDPAQPEALLGQARLALRSGDRDAARSQLQQMLQSNPKLPDAWALLARIDLQIQDTDGAEAAFARAIELAPVDFRYRIERALARIEREDYDAAQADIEHLRMEHAGQPAVAYLAGRVAFHTGRFDLAYEQLMQAQGVPAFKRELPFYLGASALAIGNAEQALDLLETFVANDPGSENGARLLARARLATGDRDGAERLLQQLLESNPDDADALDLMARLSAADGDMAAAADYRQRRAMAAPDDPFIQSALGIALIKADAASVDEGIKVLEQALRQAPNQLPADIGIVAAQLRKGDHEAALAAARAMVDKYPNNGAPQALAGIAQAAMGNLDGAQASFEQALALTPGEPSAAGNLAAIALSRGDVDAARGYYRQVLDQRPAHKDTLLALAGLEARAGNDEVAEGLLQQTIMAHPADLQPLLARAAFLRSRDRTPEALGLLQQVSSTFEDLPLYWSVVGELELITDNPQAAAASLARRVKLEPDAAPAHLRLANASAAAGDERGFERALFNALGIDPNVRAAGARRLVEYYIDQASSAEEREGRLQRLRSAAPDRPALIALDAAELVRERRYAAAEDLFRRGLLGAPDESSLILGVAQMQVAQDELTDAIATLEAALERNPRDTAVMTLLAEYLLVAGRGDDGVATLRRLVQLAPRDARARNNLAWLLRERDPELALLHARQAVELSQRSEPSFLHTLGLILLEAGDAKESQNALRDATSRAPKNPTFQFHYALALERGGNPEDAQRLLRQLLAEQNAFPEREQAEALAERLR